jgi:hypothetical protein
MGGRPLWKCGAGRMVPENTNSANRSPPTIAFLNLPGAASYHDKSLYESISYKYHGNRGRLRLVKIAPRRMNLTKG